MKEKKDHFKEAIYGVLKESIDFNDYLNAPYVSEKGSATDTGDNSTVDGRTNDSEEDKTANKRRAKVMAFLKSAQQKHSEYAYHLWPEMEEDDARSLFSKKYRGHDAEGKKYSFSNEEINNIYNLIDDVLEKTKW